jgi:hypothetical protein
MEKTRAFLPFAALQEKPTKIRPTDKKYRKTGFLITEKNASWMCV